MNIQTISKTRLFAMITVFEVKILATWPFRAKNHVAQNLFGTSG